MSENDLMEFTFEGAKVSSIREYDDGRWESDDIDADESYEIVGDTVIKTEHDDGRLERTVYADPDGDGIYSEISQTNSAGDHDDYRVSYDESDELEERFDADDSDLRDDDQEDTEDDDDLYKVDDRSEDLETGDDDAHEAEDETIHRSAVNGTESGSYEDSEDQYREVDDTEHDDGSLERTVYVDPDGDGIYSEVSQTSSAVDHDDDRASDDQSDELEERFDADDSDSRDDDQEDTEDDDDLDEVDDRSEDLETGDDDAHEAEDETIHRSAVNGTESGSYEDSEDEYREVEDTEHDDGGLERTEYAILDDDAIHSEISQTNSAGDHDDDRVSDDESDEFEERFDVDDSDSRDDDLDVAGYDDDLNESGDHFDDLSEAQGLDEILSDSVVETERSHIPEGGLYEDRDDDGLYVETWEDSSAHDSAYASGFTRTVRGTDDKDEEHFDGKITDYVVVTLSDGSRKVEDVETNESVLLTDIERVHFGDVSVAYDVEGHQSAGAAYRLYQAAFDRAPDAEGLGYWIDEIDHGMTLAQVASAFIASDEFETRYGLSPDDDEFLTGLYNNVLDRDPDEGGFEYWMGQLEGGASRSDVLASFSESEENQLNVIGQMEDGFVYELWPG